MSLRISDTMHSSSPCAATIRLAHRRTIRLSDAVLRDRDFVEYGARTGLRAQIDAACTRARLARRVVCEVANMQYLVEMVRWGAGLSLLPPMAIQPVRDDVIGIPITPALRRDMCAVTPTGSSTARRGQSSSRSPHRTNPKTSDHSS